MASTGKTVVVAVHDLTLAGQFCDEVGLMSEGAMDAVGKPRRGVDRGQHPKGLRGRGYGVGAPVDGEADSRQPLRVCAKCFDLAQIVYEYRHSASRCYV